MSCEEQHQPRRGPDGLVRTARLPLSSATLNYLATLIRGHCKKIGSRWRALPAGKIAGIVPAVLRCDQRPGDLAGGNTMGAGNHRPARRPRPTPGRRPQARTVGGAVLLDGSPIRTRRRTGTANRKIHSGKHKRHGLLVVALTDDRCRLLWVSVARPGRSLGDHRPPTALRAARRVA
ncbi:hypothetical protein [Streptomyces hokutonensis]|uniref:hypothetical protein n=1 Tax=Streptomyces hokutonensis TaxID=1306990 RepID=UPI0036B6C4BB